MSDNNNKNFDNDLNAKTQVINNKRVREEINDLEATKQINSGEINKILSENGKNIADNIKALDSNNQRSIDEEIEDSIKKMVAEETSVARAYMDLGKTESLKYQPDIKLVDDVDDTKTINPDDTVVVPEDKKKKLDKKTKYTIIAIAATVVILLAVIISVAIINNNSTKKSYSYNYDKGMEYYNDGDYSKATSYLKTASLISKGKTNLELKMALYECYYKLEDYDSAIETLKDILSYDDEYNKAITALAKLYAKLEDGESLTELINTYKDTSMKKYIESYIVNAPTANKEAGEYDEDIELTLESSDSNTTIYYTVDGSEPTTKSTQYDGTAIKISTGTTTIKAIAVDNIGVVSDTFSAEYILVYGKPDSPDISPSSGTYAQGQVFSITNIPEGATAYYTLDGSTPTTSSTVYTDEVELPVGNIVVSAIIVSEHEQTSSVTKRNYVISASASYTRAECLSFLQDKLVNKGVLTSSTKLANGNAADFSYVSNTQVDSISMYIFKLIDKQTSQVIGTYGVSINYGTVYIISGSEGSYSSSVL